MLGCGGVTTGPARRQAPGSVLVLRPAARCQREGTLQSPLNLGYRRESQLGLVLCSCCGRLRDGDDLDVLVLASPEGLGDAECRAAKWAVSSSAEATLLQPQCHIRCLQEGSGGQSLAPLPWCPADLHPRELHLTQEPLAWHGQHKTYLARLH